MSASEIDCVPQATEPKCYMEIKRFYFQGIQPVASIDKIFETNSNFHENSELRKKFNFCFSRGFC